MTKKLTYLVLAVLVCIAASAEPAGPRMIRVWEKTGAGRDGVSLSAFIPDNENVTQAVIVCPGGSYFWHDTVNEGDRVAQWLCDNGIAAFVLTYRVGGKFNFVFDTRFLFGGKCYPDMLDDIRESLKIVRDGACGLIPPPESVGVMGFSAGGHLVMLAAEEKDVEEYPRPDFVASIYPVVTMSDSRYVHKRSRRGLMGRNMGRQDLREKLSLERNVPADCPPVFIVNCEDDRTVDFHNSVLLDSALTAAGIRHRYICYPVGGHGFGTAPIYENEKVVHIWTDEFIKWLSQL